MEKEKLQPPPYTEAALKTLEKAAEIASGKPISSLTSVQLFNLRSQLLVSEIVHANELLQLADQFRNGQKAQVLDNLEEEGYTDGQREKFVAIICPDD